MNVEGLCPNCGSDDRHIVESRKRYGKTFRRCDCRRCGTRYGTIEKYIASADLEQSLGLSRIRDKVDDLQEQLTDLTDLIEDLIDLNP
jgi:hypothetical protein